MTCNCPCKACQDNLHGYHCIKPYPTACGSIQPGTEIQTCECGLLRQVDKPHAYYSYPIAGWVCPSCKIFNGEEKEKKVICRNCETKRP